MSNVFKDLPPLVFIFSYRLPKISLNLYFQVNVCYNIINPKPYPSNFTISIVLPSKYKRVFYMIYPSNFKRYFVELSGGKIPTKSKTKLKFAVTVSNVSAVSISNSTCSHSKSRKRISGGLRRL